MRYYEVYTPDLLDADGNYHSDKGEPACVTNVRKLKGLPEGARIRRVITDRDGSAVDIEYIPVVDGKAQVSGRGTRRARISWQRS